MDNQKTLQEKKNSFDDVLITGGNGMLAKKLKELMISAHNPNHKEMDITKNLIVSDYIRKINPYSINTVIHCAALKNVICTDHPIDAMTTNILGTINVAMFCQTFGAKLVYISTDYVFRGDRGDYKASDEVGPVNYYGETKLAGEYVCKALKNYLIIRSSFFPDVFPYEQAYIDQFSTRITVSEAAQRIYDKIKNKETGIKHIAGKKQSVYEYALSTAKRPVQAIELKSSNYFRPKDTSLSEEL